MIDKEIILKLHSKILEIAENLRDGNLEYTCPICGEKIFTDSIIHPVIGEGHNSECIFSKPPR